MRTKRNTFIKGTRTEPKSKCRTGKKYYACESDAKIALANCQSDRNKSQRREQRYYKCPHCSGWHLTSRPNRYQTKRSSDRKTSISQVKRPKGVRVFIEHIDNAWYYTIPRAHITMYMSSRDQACEKAQLEGWRIEVHWECWFDNRHRNARFNELYQRITGV